MGFAVINVLGMKSLLALSPLMITYGMLALAAVAQWAVTKTRPTLLIIAAVTGVSGGHLAGWLSDGAPMAAARSPVPMDRLVAQAAERVDRHKEDLAHYIDQNLPNIPDLLHANCRELQDALAARGLLCVDVGPDTSWHTTKTKDARAYRLWAKYRAAKADLDRLAKR